MPLSPGSRLGPYEVLSAIGAGGMGEVYRARDPKLNRDVALKILPEAFASDPERLARFRREAQVLASLNHPNIAAIYGFERLRPSRAGDLEIRGEGSASVRAGGGGPAPVEETLAETHALVLELVEGPTLADRIADGAIPVPEALPIAKQIADALEAAHESGVIHRDLKPANVKVRPDGTVKVLDFGLAKALEPAFVDAAPANVTNSPTISTPLGVTGVGVLLGTAAYMSPEQARGRAVDKRADIWAFGVVLFEMLTGRRLFAGETVSDNLASVLRQEITWSALPAETPATVRRVLQRCLERDPRERLRDIGEARIALKEAPADEPISTSRPFARSLPWVLLVTVAVLAAAWNMWMQNGRGAAAPQVRELAVPYPAGVEPRTEIESAFAISRDGRSVALTGAKGIERRVFVRRLDSSEVVELDLLGVNSAAFSPDGTKIAVIGSDSGLTSISLADKLRVDIAPNADNVGQLTWGDAGVLFAHDGALWIAPSGGGEPRALTTLDSARHETLHTGPIFLPGGRTVLFASQTQVPGSERIEAVRVDGGARKVVVERATTPIWSPTGHLLFARDGAVLAASFDTETVRVEGEATPVFASGIVGTTRIGGLALRLAENGTLLFAPRDFHAQRMVLVARDGAATTLGMGLGRYELPRLSPNGRRLAFSMEGSLIGTWNLERRTREALTTAAPGTGWPVWTRDGSRIVYRRYSSLFWTSTDGSNMQGEVKETVSNDYPNAPGPNADSVLVTRIRAETSADVFLTSLSGSFSPRPLLESPAFEGGAQLSPDGRWLVYASTESGKFEIHVSRFPELDRKWLVSEGTGTHPRWSANGTEIYYRGPSMMTAVPFDGRGGEPLLGKPVWLFEDEYDLGNNTTTSNYDVTPGGQFMMIRRVAQGGYLRIVLNWTEELKRILAQARAR